MAEFEVECATCSSSLSADLMAVGRRIVLNVEPCEKCQENARDDGYNEAKKEE